MSTYFICEECGKDYRTDRYCLYSKDWTGGKALLKVLSDYDKAGPERDKYIKRFCSERCQVEFLQRHPGEYYKTTEEVKANRKGGKVEKQAKKEEALEKAKVTSSESLSKISRLCLTLGFLGVHRFAVGKFISGIVMPVLLILGIISAITNKEPAMLALSAVDIVWWLFDFATIKAKKFTDKFGNTIKEN